MEDLLYILAVVAWVVYSFYKNSKKARNQRPAMKEPASSQRQETEEVESTEKEYPEVRSILKEILGEDIIPEPAPTPEPVRQEERSSMMDERRAIEQEYANLESEATWDDVYENSGKMPAKIADEQEEIRKEIEADVRKAMKKDEPRKRGIDFDLRKAVIMSEILNRPYDETKSEKVF